MAPPLIPGTHAGTTVTTPSPQEAPARGRELTTDAMERFSCISERCEDTCCRDWAVSIDRPSLDRLKRVMSGTPEGRDRLVRLVVIGSPSPQVEALAQIQLDAGGSCPLLEPDSRCSVHAEFGESSLPTACSVFPRTALAVGGQLEVGGSLACPEVARLTLLADASPRLRPAGKPMLSRPYVGKTVGADPDDGYARPFLVVRDLLLRCFRLDVPLGTRLAVAADFAHRVGDLLRARTAEREGSRRPFAERRLQAEIAETESPALIAALDRDLATLAAPGDAMAGLIVTWLLERRRLPHGPRFAGLLGSVFASIQREALGRAPDAGDAVTPSQIGQVYERRRAALDARLGARSNQLFGNYCQHFLLRNPYTDSSTVLEHLFKLGVHLAAVRFLTVTHPDLAARLDAPVADAEADARTLDQVAVHVIQTFTKAIGHHHEYFDTLLRTTAGSQGVGFGGVGFGRLVMIAKFV